LNYVSFVVCACLLAPFFCREKYDLIFTYEPSPFTVGIPAVMLRWLHNVPMIFWVQDLWPESLSATGAVHSPALLSQVANMVRWIYRHCDKILVQSEGFIDHAVTAGAAADKIEYFPNWAESLYRPVEVSDSARERRDIPDDGFVVMFAGNLGAAQSLETVIDAAKLLKDRDVYWVFLGDGRRGDWMREQIKLWELHRVLMLGSRPMETMPIYFSLADAMLVTLRADPVMTTTIPGRVQSYLACGRPIIGALDGEGAKIVRDSGAGYVVASGDAVGLADSVVRMCALSNRDRQDMGKKACAYYQDHFNRDVLVDRLEGWMTTMVRARGL
ncbi:MAG: glycosyltransferase family 4 protein, partial [Mariprofundales bacterium]|nr:glycosyltransferase family 4 protein [Mariprofundales bacterium]